MRILYITLFISLAYLSMPCSGSTCEKKLKQDYLYTSWDIMTPSRSTSMSSFDILLNLWSIWPALGALYNMNKFFDDDLTPMAAIRIRNTGINQWRRDCLHVTGTSNTADILPELDSHLETAIEGAVGLIASGFDIEFNVTLIGETGSTEYYTATYTKAANPLAIFPPYSLNKMILEEEEEDLAEETIFIVGAPHKHTVDQFFIAAVGCSNYTNTDTNADLEFFLTYNVDDPTIVGQIKAYFDKHWPNLATLDDFKIDKDVMQQCLDDVATFVPTP